VRDALQVQVDAVVLSLLTQMGLEQPVAAVAGKPPAAGPATSGASKPPAPVQAAPLGAQMSAVPDARVQSGGALSPLTPAN
jgi:hypothetical protein